MEVSVVGSISSARAAGSTLPHQDARELLSSHISQMWGYEIQLEQGNTLVVCRNGNLVDLYHRLQAQMLRPSSIDHPSTPRQLPVARVESWVYVDLRCLIAVFVVVAVKGPMTFHRDPCVLKYSLQVKRAMLAAPFADIAKSGELDHFLETLSKLSNKVKQGLSAIVLPRAEEFSVGVYEFPTERRHDGETFGTTAAMSTSLPPDDTPMTTPQYYVAHLPLPPFSRGDGYPIEIQWYLISIKFISMTRAVTLDNVTALPAVTAPRQTHSPDLLSSG
ncbi:hypothetical protein BDN72DRAFT_882049, partial [Pluteus cervinus]